MILGISARLTPEDIYHLSSHENENIIKNKKKDTKNSWEDSANTHKQKTGQL